MAADPDPIDAPPSELVTLVAPTLAATPKTAVSDHFTLVTGESPVPVVAADGGDVDVDALRGGTRYEAGPLLGEGGMGEVRLHVDRRIGRRIAKKTLHTELDAPTARRRFLREVRVQGQLEHPAVVPVYDLDVDDEGRLYFTMKRVRGDTLERVLDHVRSGDPSYVKRFTQRRLLGAFAQVCRAIDYAHARNVIHRDLKPSNVMLGDFGEVYVLDWGLAKVDGDADEDPFGEEPTLTPEQALERMEGAVIDNSGSLTVGGALLGTLAYMAPEQFLVREGEVDKRADLYGLGAILFEILTLSRMRVDVRPVAILRALMSEAVVRPSARVETVPPELDELCARALAVKPALRPASAGAIADAVESYLDGEHDLALRRDIAAKHAALARSQLDAAKAKGAARERVEAMREAMKALALDADGAEAQRVLVEVLTEVSGEVPAEARPDLVAQRDRDRIRMARMATLGLLGWLAVLPVVILIGVRSWLAVGATAGATMLGIALTRRMSKRGVSFGSVMALACIVATVVACTSCYLGAFAVVPTCAATSAMLFTISATPRERPYVGALLALGAVLPFVGEISGIVPRAYAFEPGRIVVFERAIALPQWPTMAAMIYSSLSFPLFAVWLVGKMRDTLSAAERRQFLQAWFLRQLFPAADMSSKSEAAPQNTTSADAS